MEVFVGSEAQKGEECPADERTEEDYSVLDKRVGGRQGNSLALNLPKAEVEAKEREKERARAEKKVRGSFNDGDGPVIGLDWHRILAVEDDMSQA